ncbi:Hint domain-containing protein [Acidisoma sp. C75]
MSETISNSITQGTTLTSNPVLITSTGSVIVSNADAITAPGTTAPSGWTITNQGTVVASGATHNGINLSGGGSITNSGTISGYLNGINVAGGIATVTNTGTIDSSPTKIVANTPNYKYDGIFLANGGLVTNTSGTIYGGISGVDISGGSGTVNNTGLIDTTTLQGNGVGLEKGGTVINAGSNGIYGDFSGVSIYGGPGVITNSAMISAVGLSGDGAYLGGGGSVTNLVHGSITGTYEGVVGGSSAALTVTNSGYIYGYDVGADLQGGGMITNLAGGKIEAKTTAIKLLAAGTVVTDGAIIAQAGTGTAIGFASGQTNLLLVESGATFAGLVTGGGAGSTLELGAVASGSTASLSGIGSQITGFNTITFDSGDSWSLSGSFTSFNGDTVQGLAAGDTIVMTGVTTVTASVSGGVLSLTSGTTTDTLTLGAAATTVQVQTVSGGIALTLPCFAAGTRITTPEGPKPVEDLAEGDRVVTLRGDTLPIIWKGQRQVDCASHPRPEEVQPFVIEAGAFGPAVPVRDLLLSPDHAVLVQGVLIPVKYLANGRTVRQLPIDDVTYHHIELPRHAAILAEGLPAESYLDTGDRAQLGLARDYARATTDRDIQMLRDALACAPLRITGPEVEMVRRHLARRAEHTARLAPIAERAA